MRTSTRAESNLDLVSQEQVLDHEVVALADERRQGGEEDAEWLKHPGSVAHRDGWRFALLQLVTT
jgi:hypothetical protein